MKLHLPLKLRAALLALCLTGAPSAFSVDFKDTIFKFEGTTASERSTDGSLHEVTAEKAVVSSGTATYIDSGLVVGYAIGDYKLTRDLGKAFSFNDATRISISDDYWKEGISPSSSFTLAAYVNFTNISGVNALFGTGANGNTGFSFSVVNGNLRVTTKQQADYTLTTMTALKANTWYAVAVSYSYDTTEGKYYARFYVDGDPVGKVEVGTAFNTPGTDGGAAIGSNSSGADNDLLNGAIAEFQILSGAKSQEEIKSLFGLATVNDLWWKGTATDTAWDTVSTRWASTQAATSADTMFTQGDRVHFGTEGGAVTLDENIIVRGIEAEGNWKFTLGAGKTLNSPYVHSTGGVTFSGAGTVTLDGGNNAFTGSELLVSGGTVDFIYNNSNQSSCISSGSNVKVTGGGTLKLTGHDMLGWKDVSPDAINLEGTSVEGVNKIATLQINETDSTKAMTLTSTINMSGYSEMTGSAFNTFGTSFHATGIGNIISNKEILLRNALNIEVETGGELTIRSRLTDHADGDKPKTITKTGEGKLIFSKLENASVSNWSKDLTVTGGTVQLNGVTLGTGAISLAKDTTLEVAGTVTQQTDDNGNVISGIAIVGEGKLVVLSGANLTLNSSVTLGATIENAGALTLGTSGSLRFTSRDVLEKNSDVVYRDTLNPSETGNGYSDGSYFIVKPTAATGVDTQGITEVYLGNETKGRLVAQSGEKKGAITIDPAEAAKLGGLYYITLGGEFVYQNGEGATNHAADGKTSGLVLATASGKTYLTLVMKTSLNPAATEGIIMQSDAAIQLDGRSVSLSKVTIPQDIGTIPTLTLRGNGTYTMDQATGIDATATKVGTATTDYPAWTGKIVVSNTELGGAGDGKFSIAKLNELATTETTGGQTSQTSTIEISGLSGYAYDATDGTSPTVTVDLKLTDIPAVGNTTPAVAALTLTDGTGTTGTLALNGKLSENGSIVNNSKGNVSLGGDISGWTGSYTATDKNTLLIFNGSTAQTLKATVGGGSLEVVTGSLTDNNGQPVNSLTVNSSLTLDKTITIINGGTLAFGTGGKLSFNSLADLTAKGEVTYTDGGAVGNGYRTGTFYVVKGGTTKKESLETVNIDKYTYSQEDGTLVWDTDGVVIKSIEQPGLYYVCKDTVIYDSVNKPNNAASNDTQGLVLMGGTLRMLTDLGGTAAGQDGSGIVLQKNPTDVPGTPTLTTISVADGVALNHVALDVSSDIKLKILGYNNETDREHVGEDIIMKQLTGDGTLVSGSGIMVKESGSFTGTYDGMVRLGTTNKEAVQILRADANLTVIGDAGTVSLTGQNNTDADDNKLGGIDTKGETVLLNNVRDDVSADGTTTTKVPTKVTLVNASRMEKGVLDFTVSAEEVNESLNSVGKPVVTTGAALSLKEVTLKVHEVQNEGLNLTTGGQEKDIVLFVVNDTANDCKVDNVTVNMDDCPWMTKYFTNFRVVQGSVNVIGDANTGRYAAHGQTPNGTAGLALAGKAMFRLDPQTQTPDSELAQVLDMLDNHLEAGNKGAMDKLGAALAGSSLSAVGMAVSDDVQRQLRAIRNRTTTMGVNECVVNEDMPYVNGWISGDGNYRQLSESGTDAGYQVSSWGGTVGVDVDVNPNLTLGVAVSTLFGDYTGKSADTLTGDLDTQYVSLFARVSTGSWVNTFVGTLGRADVDLERTLPGIAGKTTYKTNGMMFGFLYEIARTFALNEDASTCVQPLFNMSFTHTSLDSATEGGTADTRLTTDSASLTQFSLGLGGRLQSIVGENEYNRASIFEARALLKLDFGDRYNKLNTALAALPNATVSTRSNESGVIGAEVGASLTIPISQDAGSVFFDVNADFRADQTGVNGSVGYRINF